MPTPILNLTEWAAAQASPWLTHNLAVRYLEQGAGWFRFISVSAAPPGSPADGDCYLVDASATGAWAGHDGEIAFRLNTGWVFIAPREGFGAYRLDTDQAAVFDGAAWNALGGGGGGNPIEALGFACSDETTALTTGAAKITFRLPYAFDLFAVRASVTTAPTGAAIIVDINEGGSSILSTKLSVDATEKTSTTAASAAVISDDDLADDAEMSIDIDQVGSTIAGAGLKVWLIGRRVG